MIGLEPPMGASLGALVRAGGAVEVIRIAPPADCVRKPFFHADPIDINLAKFGQRFLQPGFRNYRSGAIEAYRLPDITVLAPDGVVFHRGAVIPESLANVMTWLADSVVERYEPRKSVRLRHPVSIERRASDGRYLIGFTPSWRNYAHWLQETLPRLFAFVELRKRDPDLRVVLPLLPENSFQQQTLDLLGIGAAAVFPLAAGEAVAFAEAYVMTGTDIWSVPPYNRLAANALVEAAVGKLATAARTGRVYLHRELPARRVANFAAVRALVEHYGFGVVSFEATPLIEQIVTMLGARHVIAEHGAGVTNILFCAPGTNVLELFNPACVQPAFWSVASACDLEFGFLVGDHVTEGQAATADWNTAYEVPLGRLEDVIRALPGAEPAIGARFAGGKDQANRPAAMGAPATTSGDMTPIDLLTEIAVPVPVPLFMERRITRKIVAPAIALPQPLPLLAPDLEFVDAWVPDYHGRGHRQQSYDISCYFAADAVVTGRGHIFLDGNLVMSPEVMPEYWRKMITNPNPLPIGRERSLPVRVIERPTIVFAGHGIEVYGHFLIEMLMRLIVARRALGSAMGKWGLLLERITPAWFRKILLEFFRIDEGCLEYFDSRHEGVQLRYAAIPTLTSFDGWFHPFTNDIIDEVIRIAGAQSAGPATPRLMVSRALFANPATMQRRCLNELKLAEIAAKEFGFAVVANETFPWAAQIDLFHKAEIIIGEYGFGLHNAIFAGPGTRVGSIGMHALTQSMIGALRGHRNAYLRTARDAKGQYAVDEDLFRRFLAAVTADAAMG